MMLLQILLCLATCVGATSQSNILLLGGNGMLGSATVKALLETDMPYKLWIVNRGNWYWDTETTVKPYVRHLECTRGDGFREECAELAENYFDVVVDFSAYDPLDIEDVLILLQSKFKRYIYISSDSVYEVSNPKTHDGYLKETDAVRPHDENTQKELSVKDNYGHRKLEGEEVLTKFHTALNFDYITLRLPDVIGPRDNTHRFWKYYMWAKLHHSLGPIHIPKHIQNKPISLVYSVDVGKLIAWLVVPQLPVEVLNQAYNLGFREPTTLKKMITFMGKFIDKGEISFDESEEAHLTFGIPSVSRGPVDISKAVKTLDWSPTSVYAVIKEACEFYEKAEYNMKYKFSLDRVLDDLDVRGDRYRDFLDVHYDKISPKKKAKQEL